MASARSYTYEDWLKQQYPQPASVVAEIVEAADEEEEQSASSDDDNTYEYVAMKDPEQPYTLQPAYAYYAQPALAYAYPEQKQEEKESSHVSVKTKTKPKTMSKPAKEAPAPQQQAIAYAYAYPVPVAIAAPNYPVPVEAPKEKAPAKKEESAKRTWVGRTKKEVDEDNIKIAVNEGVYNPNAIVPKDAKHDQLFWCIEPDGNNTLRTFQTIEDDLYPGKWKVDPRYGNAYFVRDKEKEKKEKCKK